MLSETDWAMPLATLSASTKHMFFGFFGQEVKKNTVEEHH
jgi:hypothetical protein